MLFPALLTAACLVFVSSGQTTSVDNSVKELVTSTISYPFVELNADPTMSLIYQTPSAIQSSAELTATSTPETSSAVATSAPVVTAIVPSTMAMATSETPVATSESPMMTSLPPVTTIIAPVTTSISPVTTSISPVTASISPVTTSISPVTTSISPVTTSISPALTSIPSVLTSIPSVLTSIPSVLTSIPSVLTSIPSVLTSIPSVLTSIPSFVTFTPTTTPPMITITSPVTVSTGIPAIPNIISSTATSMPPAKSSSPLYTPRQSSLHEALISSSSQIQATSSHSLPSSAAPSQTTASIQTQASTADTLPWQVSVAVLAVLTGVLLLTTVLLSIALCVAICRFRARNLTYTIKNPEAKESKYWIETKSSPSEDKASPVRAEEGHKVWYAESATAFPVFPMAHLAATKDPAADSSPSVQTFRLARAYRQSSGNSAPSRPPTTSGNTPTVPASASAPSAKMEANSDEASNRTTDGAVVNNTGGEGEVVGRAIIIPTTPTSDSDLSKAKKRRPPPLKPIGAVPAEPQEGTYSKQGGSSSHNPTTPGSCSVHKGQVYSGPDPRAELMKEYSAMLHGKQNTT